MPTYIKIGKKTAISRNLLLRGKPSLPQLMANENPDALVSYGI